MHMHSPLPGIKNLGNSCYSSAVIQALLATSSFVSSFMGGSVSQHPTTCNLRRASRWCPVCELYDIIVADGHGDDLDAPPKTPESLEGAGRQSRARLKSHAATSLLTPRRLLRGMKTHGRFLNFLKQEDSHKFFLTLLNSLNAVMVREGAQEAKRDVSLLDEYVRSTEPLQGYTFGCTIRHQTNCCKCGAVSKRFIIVIETNLSAMCMQYILSKRCRRSRICCSTSGINRGLY